MICLHMHRDISADRDISAEHFWRHVNHCADQATVTNTSLNHQLTRKANLSISRRARAAGYVRDDDDWLEDMFTRFNRLAVAKAELLLHQQQPRPTADIINSYVDNPYLNGYDSTDGYNGGAYHRSILPPTGRGGYRGRGGARGGGRGGRNGPGSGQETMMSRRKEVMQRWLKATRKENYAKKLGDVCGFFHSDTCTAETNSDSHCVVRKTGRVRKHACVCGKKHKMVNRKQEIWK
eukprot:842086_1